MKLPSRLLPGDTLDVMWMALRYCKESADKKDAREFAKEIRATFARRFWTLPGRIDAGVILHPKWARGWLLWRFPHRHVLNVYEFIRDDKNSPAFRFDNFHPEKYWTVWRDGYFIKFGFQCEADLVMFKISCLS